jgi:hypothetical protein
MGLGPLLKPRFILSHSFVESLLDKNIIFIGVLQDAW